MSIFLTIVRNTPWWVFVLFALLLALGVQALRGRVISVWRLLVTPAIFIGWGVTAVALQLVNSPILIVDWVVAASIGAAIAWTTTRLDDVRIDRARQRVSLPGSALPLIRNLLIFSAKYGLAVAVAIAPASRASLAFWDIAVSGVSAGYFLSWLARFASAIDAQPTNYQFRLIRRPRL
jgi:hypothetical protein